MKLKKVSKQVNPIKREVAYFSFIKYRGGYDEHNITITIYTFE